LNHKEKYGPNVISFFITTGKQQYPVIGAYIPPGDTTTLASIFKASNRFAGQPIILMGDINVDLQTNTPSNHDTEIMALLATLGLEDMSTHFLQRKNFQHGNTWSMEREGDLIQSRCNYILGTDRRLFKYIQIKEPNYNSDHLMVAGRLRSAPKKETANMIKDEYNKLKSCIEIQAPEVNRQAKAPWISTETWKLIDAWASKSKSHSYQPGKQEHSTYFPNPRSTHRDGHEFLIPRTHFNFNRQ
jgi:hypothetical protein